MIAREAPCLVLGHAPGRERLGGGRGERTKTLRRTIDHGDRYLGGDPLPVLPAMELREVVGAHDPYKAQAGDPAAQALARYRIPEKQAGRLPMLRPPAWVFLTGLKINLSSTGLRNPDGSWKSGT